MIEALVAVKVFEVEEKKPELLAAGAQRLAAAPTADLGSVRSRTKR